MPSINTSILILALMAVSPLATNAAPQAQVSSAAKSSAAAASSAAVSKSSAAASAAASSIATGSVKPSASSVAPAASSSVASVAKSSTAAAVSSTASSAIKSSSSAAASSSSSAALVASSGTIIAGTTDANALLKLHNDFRTHYGAAAVTWDNTLAAYAQKASNTCKFQHTGGPNGENLAAGAGGGFNYTTGFNLWGNEASKYNWNSPGYGSDTGHFTQVVWKATTKIGCGVTQCADGTIFTGYGPSTYLVCEYQTPGNVVGNNNQYFKDNVGTYR